jgi:DNA-directed RNA polymerase sigma subunit (sigma70/sigma32)
MQSNVTEHPPESLRKEIFLALVEAQDQGMRVAESFDVVARRFGISKTQIRQIEQEGLDQQWPPL